MRRRSDLTTTTLSGIPVLAAVVLSATACWGSAGSPRATLETTLAHDRGKTICSDTLAGGSCKSFHAKSAACAKVGRRLRAARFYRCRVFYDNGGQPDAVCAAMNGPKLLIRPLRWCQTKPLG
jgi:hypothetical protein